MEPPNPPERRREPRWPCGVDVAVLPLSSQGGFVEARVVDFSEHGIGLSMREPLAVGEQFCLKIRLERLTLVLYTARSCQPIDGRYRIAAEFSGTVGAPGESPEMVRIALVAHLHAAASQNDGPTA